jgi:hypothetical protein
MPSLAIRIPKMTKASRAAPLAIFSHPWVLLATTPPKQMNPGTTLAQTTVGHLARDRRKATVRG